MESVFLTLENGRVFEGRRFGAPGDVTGELVFTTGMTGYLETLTDPSYYGQIVVQTFPLIGNYGVIPADFESAGPVLKAYVVREWCQEPSNFRCEGALDAFLRERGVVGLYGIDTRALTRVVREHGTMNARIAAAPVTSPAELAALAAYRVTGAVDAVSAATGGAFTAAKRRVALWDFGGKGYIRRELERRGCEVVAVPARATAAELLALRPDGVVLTNGPGDPAENTGVIRELRTLLEAKVPVFGICLGHQLLALAKGGRTGKMKYGHRGANQPARELATGRIYITSQNHGYAVLTDSLPADAELSFVNVNDGTCEGVLYRDVPAFSVQFHPEAAAGPQDTGFLFDRFVAMTDAGR